MKKLLLFLIILAAGWYGWGHYRTVLEHRPSHEAVIENESGRQLERVRLTVDGQTFVKEEIPSGQSVTFSFRVNHDSAFELHWGWSTNERSWSGGMVPLGPMSQRHFFRIDEEGGVMYRAGQK
jgi:hypothetical protein